MAEWEGPEGGVGTWLGDLSPSSLQGVALLGLLLLPLWSSLPLPCTTRGLHCSPGLLCQAQDQASFRFSVFLNDLHHIGAAALAEDKVTV